MIRTLSLIVFFIAFNASGVAGQGKTAKDKPVAKKKLLIPQAYLGNGDFKGGPIAKDQLAHLLRQGLSCRDSLGHSYKITGFELAYSERMLYEDSVGNPMWVNDYLSEYCLGDTLSAGVSATIYERFKAGDTLYINNVKVIRTSASNEQTEIAGLGMKCIVEK